MNDRFWSKVEKTDGCWLWVAGRGGNGYGRFRYEGRDQYAHRLAYESLVGPVPAGLQLDHLCRVRHCVNPTHLEPVTNRENVRRSPIVMARKERCERGHVRDYVRPNGNLDCRTCRYENVRRHRAKAAAA